MKSLCTLLLASSVALVAVGCSDDGSADDNNTSFTAPTDLKVTTLDGKPHLTWSDVEDEDMYIVERMDHAAGGTWTAVKDGDELVPNTTQFHDATAQQGGSYMYRVVAMKGSQRKLSNEVTWP